MKISILVGSFRDDSYNMKVAKFIKNRYKDRIDFVILDNKKVPMFDGKLGSELPKEIKLISSEIKSSDGLMIITPEYNHSIPGGLKNTLDWLSLGDSPMKFKPYMLLGASIGSFGTARAQAQLRQIFNSGNYSMNSIPNNEFLISEVSKKIDDKGNIIDLETLKRLDRDIDKFIEYIGKLS